MDGLQQNEISTEYRCSKCRDTGWENYTDDKGYEYTRECSCGIRKRQILEKRLRFANIPEAFKKMRLNTFSRNIYRNPESLRIIEIDCKAVDWWFDNIERMKAEGKGLYLYSNCKGNGKTRMVASIANELVCEHGMNVKFATSIQIINEIKASWDKNDKTTENQLLNDLSTVEVLIIDDFGIESVKDWISEKIYQIINQRYINNLITIYTSNLAVDELTYDDRIVNRIVEKSYMLRFPEESIRTYINEQNMAELKAAIAR